MVGFEDGVVVVVVVDVGWGEDLSGWWRRRAHR